MNLAILLGDVTDPPRTGAMPDGTATISFRLKTETKEIGDDGRERERTDYHTIEVMGRYAESLGRNLHAGMRVLVEGQVRPRSYEKDGRKVTVCPVRARHVQFLGGDG